MPRPVPLLSKDLAPTATLLLSGQAPPNNELATLYLLVRASPKKPVQNHRLLGLCARSSLGRRHWLFTDPQTKLVTESHLWLAADH